LLVVDRVILEAGISIFTSSAALGAFDAVLAATAVEAGAECLVSADRSFAELEEVAAVFPDRAGLAEILDR
jgi:hypothetical protein